jgi:hypothetical protein
MWSSAGRMVKRKARRSRAQELVHGSGSQPESARGVCGGSPQNRRVTWLSHKTKSGGSAGGDGIRVRREASMPGGHTAGSQGLCREDADCGERVAARWEIPSLDHIAPEGMYLYLSSRDSVVICPTRRDFIYIALGLDGNSSIRTAS